MYCSKVIIGAMHKIKIKKITNRKKLSPYCLNSTRRVLVGSVAGLVSVVLLPA